MNYRALGWSSCAVSGMLLCIFSLFGCQSLITSQTSVDVPSQNGVVEFEPAPDPYFLYMLSSIALEKGDAEMAEEHLIQAIALDETSSYLEIELAGRLWRKGDANGTLQHALTAVRKDPKDIKSRLFLAGFYTTQRRNEEALAQ